MTQTLTEQLPEFERAPFKQTAVELKIKFSPGLPYWLALADAFEALTDVQAEFTLPELGRRLEDEIFAQFTLGDLPE